MTGAERMARDPAYAATEPAIVDLARQIQLQIDDLVASGAGSRDIVALIDDLPRAEKLKAARTVFDRLPPQDQWQVLEQVLGTEGVHEVLAGLSAPELLGIQRGRTCADLVAVSRTQGLLDTSAVPVGETLVLGLFREHDALDALQQGRASTTCARQLSLRAEDGSGRFRVIQDTFNPASGYFVTGDYDENTWRKEERVPSHTFVRVGSVTDGVQGKEFTPVLYAAGRVDVERGDVLVEGRLYLGYLVVANIDVFGKRAEGGTSR